MKKCPYCNSDEFFIELIEIEPEGDDCFHDVFYCHICDKTFNGETKCEE